LRREAGIIAFEGTFREGHGEGEFTFTPNPDYPKMLDWLGVEFEMEKGERDRELFGLAVNDVSTEFIRSMQVIGYKVPLQQYMAFRIFKVDPEYVRAMSAKGFGNLSAEKLVETRIHNVTPEYIQKMCAAGNDLTLDQYIQFRIHGVTPEFVRELRSLGYSRVPAEQLVAMRIHGVTPEFIGRVAAAGYRNVPVEKLVQMRIFDIDPEMVKALDQDRR
jgi:hypothetical protein